MQLVSVIVPVYNVEEYLRKCIESILAQSYTNLEIILVDDGSPDNCGVICDEYASMDARIKVIHKENGGLSDARNAGLDICTGKYVTFVDSDDWIEDDYIESFMFYAEPNKIICCGYNRIIGDNVVTHKFDVLEKYKPFKFINLLQKEEIESLCGYNNLQPITNAVWNKLFPKILFDKIKFPKNKVFEDTFIIYDLFLSVDEIVVLPSSNYNYICRSGSICSSPKKSNDFNYLEARQLQNSYVYKIKEMDYNSKILIVYALLTIYINFRKGFYILDECEIEIIKSEMKKYGNKINYKHKKIYYKYLLVMYFPWMIKSIFAIKTLLMK